MMETTRHQRIARPTMAVQTTKLPDPIQASQVEPPVALEMEQQLSQAAQLGHQLGQVTIATTPGPAIQAKLTVGAPDDTYEQEADRVAGQVMRMTADEDQIQMKPLAAGITPLLQRLPDSDQNEESVQRMTGAEEEEETLPRLPEQDEEDIVQRSSGGAGFAAGADVEERIGASRGRGSPLAADARAFMEPRFGADFSQVTVHTDAQADQLNRQLSARAFTTGRDIYFRQGAYAPQNDSGQRLLAHELTHVVQQGGAGTRVQREDGDGDEAPADPVAKLKADLEALRQEIYAIRRESPRLLGSEQEHLETLSRKITALSAQVTDEPDQAKAHFQAFKEWRDGDGYGPWQTFTTYRQARIEATQRAEEREAYEAAQAAARRAAAAAVAWSAECDAVFADMNSQYQRWDGTKTNRGAWWGSAQPGSRTGSRRVPDSVVNELRRRVAGTTWQFSDSFSGGISFHRKHRGIDFIYHMLPPS